MTGEPDGYVPLDFAHYRVVSSVQKSTGRQAIVLHLYGVGGPQSPDGQSIDLRLRLEPDLDLEIGNALAKAGQKLSQG